jgi:predicted DNA-binding transcriptional regulator AlpA
MITPPQAAATQSGNSIAEIDYEKLAECIAIKLKLLPPPDKVIWDAKKIAEHLGVTEKHVTDKVSKTFGFPTPIKLPSSTGRKGHSRWYAKEVTDWIHKQKK